MDILMMQKKMQIDEIEIEIKVAAKWRCATPSFLEFKASEASRLRLSGAAPHRAF